MILILTVNMKCFEIILFKILNTYKNIINRKHEMFWNTFQSWRTLTDDDINRKHEMFWNTFQSWRTLTDDDINRKHEMFWNVLYCVV